MGLGGFLCDHGMFLSTRGGGLQLRSKSFALGM